MAAFKTSTLAALLAAAAALPSLAQDVKIGYINKMGDHPWFVAEVAGAKARPRSSAPISLARTCSSTPT